MKADHTRSGRACRDLSLTRDQGSSLQSDRLRHCAFEKFPSLTTHAMESICSLPLTSDLFTQAVHPSNPIVAIGLSSGHVQCIKLPPLASDDDSDPDDAASASDKGYGLLETAWRTRRHKGSARALQFSHDGNALYSAGSDGLVKAAATETGQVFSKIAVPDEYGFP